MDNKKQGNFVEFGNNQLPLPQPETPGSLVQNSQPESGVGLWMNPNAEHNTQDLGNKALFSPENQPDLATNPGEALVSTESYQNEPQDNANPALSRDANNNPSLNAATIKTTTTLSSDAVNAIDQAKAKFFQDGDANSFYEQARNYMEENLSNSYNRELGK